MLADRTPGIPQLRAGLRDLVALSTVPAAWVGREPADVAGGLADALLALLPLDFAFVRLCDPAGSDAVEVTRGSGWAGFPRWLEHHLGSGGRIARGVTVPMAGPGGERYRGVIMPIGVDAEGGVVAAATARPEFPTDIDRLLLSLATNHAATSFQSAGLIRERRRAEQELRSARDELERKVAERTAALRRSEAYLAASRSRLVDAADEERRRVARDLHDGAQSRLVYAVMTLQLASSRDDLTGELRTLVEDALAHTSMAIDELRELSHGIHPAALASRGLRAAVEALADRAPLPVRLAVPDQRYAGPVESAAYFVVAESLTNVAKHARARAASVSVADCEGSLIVEVRDDGIGGADMQGHGLVGMQDRLAALQGELRVTSPPGAGTIVAASIPLSGG
jgi:signal transduction histidine kinase